MNFKMWTCCKKITGGDTYYTLLSRYVFGSVIMIGVAPEYLAIWLVWRGASLVFPSWIYQWGDDKLYSLYQRLVLFFFETCTNLEVVYLYMTEWVWVLLLLNFDYIFMECVEEFWL